MSIPLIKEVPKELLVDIKDYLDLDVEDINEDKKISGIILRGMNRINEIGGSLFDYMIDDSPKSLLLDYVMYAREKAVDDFMKNYSRELTSLSLREKVKQDVGAQEEI